MSDPQSIKPTVLSKAHDPYDADRPLMMRCACGGDHASDQHGAMDTAQATQESMGRE